MTRLVIGLGTGRCGTLSLAQLFSNQADAHITHELLTPAGRELSLPAWDWRPEQFLAHFDQLRRRGGVVTGDVAFFWLNGIDALLKTDPTVRVVCLSRPREAVIASYLRKVPAALRCWRVGNRSLSEFRNCYPHYSAHTDAMALGLFWDEYHARLATLLRRYSQLRMWSMSVLDSVDGLYDLLSFAGFATPVVRCGIWLNRTV